MFHYKVLPNFLVIAALLPILYITAPLVHMTYMSSWNQLTAVLSDKQFMRAVLTSVESAVWTTAVSLVFGLPTAFLLSRRHFIGKRLIESLLLLPLLLPPVVGGIGQLFLYGPMTLIGSWFAGHHLPLTDSIAGVVLAQSYITSPFMILSAKAGFEEIPQDLREITKILGGGLWHMFWYVSIPIARTAIIAGMALTFARAIGEFGATMIMAYHPYTLPVDIWVEFTSGGLDSIIPITAVVVVLAFLIAFLASFRSSSI